MRGQRIKSARAKRLVRYVPDYAVYDFETTGVNWMDAGMAEGAPMPGRRWGGCGG